MITGATGYRPTYRLRYFCEFLKGEEEREDKKK
jgi:hypothetical protein